MKIKALSNKVTSKVGLKVLEAKKSSPKVMFAAGVVGVVATVVLASKATLKLEEVLQETQENLEKADRAFAIVPDEKYSNEDLQKDKLVTYAKAVVKIGKLYGPAIIVGVASIGLLTGAHVTLTRRNAGLVAAYAGVEKAFNEYRKRVLDEVGDEKERELRYGTEVKEIYSETKEGEPVVTQVKVPLKGSRSMYEEFFEPTNINWSPVSDYNLVFLRAQQNVANQKLQTRGWLLLNEVREALGFDKTKAGMVMGWVLDGEGDDYVDFGIWADKDMERLHAFLTGREEEILLDFNVVNIFNQL